ncbi:MAG: F0F1 ATP synthase subunit delta [Gammaproteobacteria bacterium]
MELNLTTFILEIVNFLILVWLLQRFLYKPVLNVIAKRKAGIDQALAEAARIREEAAALQEQYNEHINRWEREKRDARERLQQEITAQRTKMLEELNTALENERHKNRIIEERRKADERLKMESLALSNAASFAATLLKQAAGPELERRLFELLLERLEKLPAATAENLRSNHEQDPVSIAVFSAYPLADEQRAELQHRLGAVLGKNPSYEFHHDKALIAGLRIHIGAWALGVNLLDELQGFTQFAHE